MSQNENELKNEEEKDNNEEENNQEINMDEKEVNKEINMDEKEENKEINIDEKEENKEKEKEIKFKKGDLNDDQLDNINCEILKEDYPEYDLSFKVIVIGDSGI